MEKILGQALKKEREMRGISMADIATETRIGTRYLQALENEDFSVFPGVFYIRYYIKNYLQACGADETAFFNRHYDYLQSIMDQKGEPPPDQYLGKLDYVKFKRRRTLLIVLLLSLLAAILLYWFYFRAQRVAATSAPFSFPAFASALIPDSRDFCFDRAPIAMRMTFTGSCWLQLWRSGEKIVEKVFSGGDVLTGHGYQLLLVMSNPEAARLLVNGRDWPLAPEPGGGMKLALTPDRLPEA
ncbi:MAG TPA: helix-turn-helix domain-containing protein [Candidatus Binatia bacterium]|nr:helix-turn-helix domain-containing protein [Candidatus Binatia bacterium]